MKADIIGYLRNSTDIKVGSNQPRSTGQELLGTEKILDTAMDAQVTSQLSCMTRCRQLGAVV